MDTTINSGDTSWLLISSALVLMMTPALAFFYGGMVRKKNVLSTLNLSFIMMALISVQWILYGYSLAFGADYGGLIGGLNFAGLAGVRGEPNPDYAPTVPHLAFAAFQMMFAIITPALITGAFVERVRFKAFMMFSLLWATLVYDPVCHWVWGAGGILRRLGALCGRHRRPHPGRLFRTGVRAGDRATHRVRQECIRAGQHSLQRVGGRAVVDGLVRL